MDIRSGKICARLRRERCSDEGTKAGAGGRLEQHVGCSLCHARERGKKTERKREKRKMPVLVFLFLFCDYRKKGRRDYGDRRRVGVYKRTAEARTTNGLFTAVYFINSLMAVGFLTLTRAGSSLLLSELTTAFFLLSLVLVLTTTSSELAHEPVRHPASA